MPYKDPEKKRAYDKARRAANWEKFNAQTKAWQAAHPGRHLTYVARWKANNLERFAAYQARWKAENVERQAMLGALWRAANLERKAATNARWATANRDRRVAYVNRHRALKLQATPAWANQALIYSFYRMGQLFGLEVDHIIPLISRKVCGLHVEHNLQLLTPAENHRKGNRFQQ